jgi:hypothetical protein
MTEVQRQATWLRWLVADGPVPVTAAIEALHAHGFDTRNRWRLARAKTEADVVSRRNGYGPGASFFWMLRTDHSALPETPNTWAHCNVCQHSLRLPATTLPRPCITTPGCPGCHQPPPTITPPPHNIETRPSQTGFDRSTWRSRPSPLRLRR